MSPDPLVALVIVSAWFALLAAGAGLSDWLARRLGYEDADDDA